MAGRSGEEERASPFGGGERVALVLVALAPAALVPGALDRFVFAKVAAVAAAAAIAAFGPGRGRLPGVVTGLVAAGAAILAVSAAASAAPLAALLGRAPRYEGVFVLPVYVAAAATGARLLGPGRRRGAVPWWLRALVVVTVAVAFEAVLETAGLRPLATDVARPGSLFGNASDEGAFGALVLGPLAAVAVRVRDRWCLVGAAAAVAVVALSASRGALLGAVAVGVVLLVAQPARSVRLAVAAGLVVLVVVALALPLTRGRILDTSPLAAGTVHGRELLWEETVALVGHHPLLGVGPSGFVDAVPAEQGRAWQLDVGSATPVDSPHDWLLQAAAAGGLPLLAVAVALAVVVGRRGWRGRRPGPSEGEDAAFTGLLAGLAGYGVALLFHLTSPGTTPLAAFFAGALLAEPASRRSGRVAATRASGVVLAALALLLLAAGLAEVPLRSAVVDVAAGDYPAARRALARAEDLRPWDAEIDATAAHAFVVAAERDAGRAAPSAAAAPADGANPAGTAPAGTALTDAALTDAAGPAAAELDRFPDSLQAVEDGATLDELEGRLAAADRLLGRGARLAPDDPQVLLLLGTVAAGQHRFAAAAGDLLRSAALDPASPAPWLDLAAIDRATGHLAAARQASAAARRRGG